MVFDDTRAFCSIPPHIFFNNGLEHADNRIKSECPDLSGVRIKAGKNPGAANMTRNTTPGKKTRASRHRVVPYPMWIDFYIFTILLRVGVIFPFSLAKRSASFFCKPPLQPGGYLLPLPVNLLHSSGLLPRLALLYVSILLEAKFPLLLLSRKSETTSTLWDRLLPQIFRPACFQQPHVKNRIADRL